MRALSFQLFFAWLMPNGDGPSLGLRGHTVLVLFFGVANVVTDLGRPDRIFYVIFHGHFRSPLLWDVASITSYLIGSSVYLFLPLIPDIALLRDRFKGSLGDMSIGLWPLAGREQKSNGESSNGRFQLWRS